MLVYPFISPGVCMLLSKCHSISLTGKHRIGCWRIYWDFWIIFGYLAVFNATFVFQIIASRYDISYTEACKSKILFFRHSKYPPYLMNHTIHFVKRRSFFLQKFNVSAYEQSNEPQTYLKILPWRYNHMAQILHLTLLPGVGESSLIYQAICLFARSSIAILSCF